MNNWKPFLTELSDNWKPVLTELLVNWKPVLTELLVNWKPVYTELSDSGNLSLLSSWINGNSIHDWMVYSTPGLPSDEIPRKQGLPLLNSVPPYCMLYQWYQLNTKYCPYIPTDYV